MQVKWHHRGINATPTSASPDNTHSCLLPWYENSVHITSLFPRERFTSKGHGWVRYGVQGRTGQAFPRCTPSPDLFFLLLCFPSPLSLLSVIPSVAHLLLRHTPTRLDGYKVQTVIKTGAWRISSSSPSTNKQIFRWRKMAEAGKYFTLTCLMYVNFLIHHYKATLKVWNVILRVFKINSTSVKFVITFSNFTLHSKSKFSL